MDILAADGRGDVSRRMEVRKLMMEQKMIGLCLLDAKQFLKKIIKLSGRGSHVYLYRSYLIPISLPDLQYTQNEDVTGMRKTRGSKLRFNVLLLSRSSLSS